MQRSMRFLTACLILASGLLSAGAPAAASGATSAGPASGGPKTKNSTQHPNTGQTVLPPAQETGFLNRKVELHGAVYKFQVYLPEEYRREEKKEWPMILFLHGIGERGQEGMYQTQVGLPQAVRDHPERWPFLIVIPQCTYPNYWTDPEMLAVAMAALDQEQAEFHTDPERTYLTGLSMGGYGAWELAKMYPKRWAASAIMAGSIFWSYTPERWQEQATLPGEYAHSIGRLPIWIFHGSDDTTVPEKGAELMYTALKANSGDVRLWVYQGLQHDSWTRAYNEQELPRWLLEHRTSSPPLQGFSERIVVPPHPPSIKLPTAALDAIAGEYYDANGTTTVTLYRQGDQFFEKDRYGSVYPLEAESPTILFYPQGGYYSRLIVEHDAQGRITGLIYRDDRHEERWERKHVTIAKK